MLGLWDKVLESFGEIFQNAVKGSLGFKVLVRPGRGDGVGQFFSLPAVILEKTRL